MQKIFAKTATAVIAVILIMTSIAAIAFGQLSHVGNTPSTTPGYPNLGPLPAGVTPDYTIEQVAYLSFRPNPIGLGQSLLVNFWTTPGTYHAFYMQGYEVDIIKPNGDTETVGPINSYLGDCTAWFEYVPDQVGTWQFKFRAPGTYIPAGEYWDLPGSETGGFFAGGKYYTLYTSVYYTPSETDWQELTVQADLVASWPPAPLPTDYWTRPVSPDKREWWPITGNYPWTGIYYYPGGRMLYPSNYRYTPYVQAPNTAHVVWRRQGAISGLIGGDAYQNSFTSSASTPTIIYAGRCYQSFTKVLNGESTTVWECYDLRTGQIYWDIKAATITVVGFFGPSTVVVAPTEILYEPPGSPTIPGSGASSNWRVSLVAITDPSGDNEGRLIKWDPWTGAVTSNVTCEPTGLSVARAGQLFPGGEYGPMLHNNTYVYSIQNLGSSLPADQRYRLIEWTAAGSTSNFASRILSNVSFPRSQLGAVDYEEGVAVYVEWAVPPGGQWCIGLHMVATDLKTGINTFEYSTNDTINDNIQTCSSPVADRGKVAFAMHGRHWNAYDLRTGQKVWQSELTAYPWGLWWPYATSSYDINETKSIIISGSYAGVYAFDWDDGSIVWHYIDPDVPFESPYGSTPFQSGCRIADGKVYLYNTEHSASEPATRGWRIYCLNATTGELLWKMEGPMFPGAVADGYLTASNRYDGYMYVFGKGESATTVETPDVAVPLGTAFTIKGTVLDVSPGDQGSFENPTQRLDAAKVVPCVSKDSMTTLMEYLYIGNPIDGIWHNETITGVPVSLTAIGSDNSYYDLGTVTTDGYYGTFSLAWTPPKEDKYNIIAAFNGDDSYGSSSAATAVTIGPATPTPSSPEIPTPVDYTPWLYAIMAAVIVAIIIGIIAILIAQRRR